MSAPPPVFILGAPFSGVARLGAMLARHPALYVLPELCLFMADRVDDLLDIFRISQGAHGDGLLRAVAQLQFGAQRDAEIEAARDWLAQRRDRRVGELIEEFAASVAPRRLLIVDSESPLRPLDLWRLRRQLPEARAVQLLRHPWTQGQRMSAWLSECLFVPPDFKDHSWDPPMADPQIPWLRCNANIEAAFAPSRELHRLRVETLDGDGASGVLKVLCEWIGVPTDTAILAAMVSGGDWAFAGHGPRSAPFGLEAEGLEPLLGAGSDVALDLPLPWRADAIGFDASVVTRARAYGYR